MANRICSAAFRSPLKAPRSEQKQQAIESDEQRVALTSLTNVLSHSEQQHDSPQLHMESTLADPKATSLPGSPSPRKSGRRRSSISSTEQHDSPARALLRAETALAEATAAALPESPSQPGRSGRRRSSVSSAGGRRSSTSSAGSGWGRAAALLAQLDDERERRIAAEADAREARAELEERAAAHASLEQALATAQEEAARLRVALVRTRQVASRRVAEAAEARAAGVEAQQKADEYQQALEGEKRQEARRAVELEQAQELTASLRLAVEIATPARDRRGAEGVGDTGGAARERPSPSPLRPRGLRLAWDTAQGRAGSRAA